MSRHGPALTGFDNKDDDIPQRERRSANKRSPGPDQSVSIDMRDLRELVDGTRKIEAALGAKKSIHAKEAPVRTWAHRSVVSVAAIPAGAVIAEGMVWTKRPGTGIPSKDLPKVLGRKAKRSLPKDTILSWDDLT